MARSKRKIGMKHFVYILQAKDGRLYTGYTTDLKRRLKKHQSGKGAKFTKAFGAKKMLYHEAYATRSKALRREAEIKSWNRRKKEELALFLEGYRYIQP